MKTTIVPAQITTVEDKIAGNLGLTQILLLIAPVFGGSALFVALPPFFSYGLYKIILIVCLAVLFGTLSIRVKDKILLVWLATALRYNSRPKYYVFNKNDTFLRDITENLPKHENIIEKETVKKSNRILLPRLKTADIIKMEGIMANPEANLQIKTNRKGEFSVYITEIQ